MNRGLVCVYSCLGCWGSTNSSVCVHSVQLCHRTHRDLLVSSGGKTSPLAQWGCTPALRTPNQHHPQEQLFEAAKTGKSSVIVDLLGSTKESGLEGLEGSVGPLTAEAKGLYGRTALRLGWVKSSRAMASNLLVIKRQKVRGFVGGLEAEGFRSSRCFIYSQDAADARSTLLLRPLLTPSTAAPGRRGPPEDLRYSVKLRFDPFRFASILGDTGQAG